MNGFWPTTLVGWMQAASPVATLLAVAVAVRASYQNNRWRHEDFASERRRIASMITGIGLAPLPNPEATQLAFPADTLLRITTVKLHNDSPELIRDVKFRYVELSSGRDLALSYGNRRVSLNLQRLAAGASYEWTHVNHLAITLDDEGLPDCGMLVTWTDAAGWRWQYVGSNEPERIDQSPSRGWPFNLFRRSSSSRTHAQTSRQVS